METFAEFVRARSGDDHVALRFEGRSWTWDEVVGEAAVRATAISTIPTGEGRNQRHIGALLQNVPDFVFWLLAAGLSGDVIVGINPTRRGAELAHDIRHTDCDLLVTEPLYRADIDALELPLPADRIVDIESDTYVQWLAPHRGAGFPDALPDPSSILLLMFSSGSTGAPKAVICTQGRLSALTDRMVDRVSLRRDSISYMCMPLFHGHAIMMNLATALKVGSTIVMPRKFSASGFVRDIHEHGVTFFNYVGRALSYILATEPDPRDADSGLELAFGTEASPAEVVAFEHRFRCEIREGYGGSEGVMRINPTPGSPPNALGVPVGGVTVEIRNDAGDVCPPARFDTNGLLLNSEDATGEMVAVGRGPYFEGYYKNPEAMADRLKGDGHDYWSGDLGYRDEDGYVYFAGRSSDWVRVDGENFSTAPVERIMSRHAPFASVLAYAVPDPRTGDQLMCAVQLAEGAEFDPAAFAAFLGQQSDLGTKWRPRFIRLLDAVPMTANGKVNKAPLRATAWESPSVWWMPSRGHDYREMTDTDRALQRQQFVEAGRENLLPAAAAHAMATTGGGSP